MKSLVGVRKAKLSSGEYSSTRVAGIGGVAYDITEPESIPINLNQIAVGLARTPRYYGDTGDFTSVRYPVNDEAREEAFKFADKSMFSVAQHIVMGVRSAMFMGDLGLAWEFFVHDIPEHWLGDMKAPIKKLLGEKFKEIENGFLKVVCGFFEVPYPLSTNCDILDQNMAEWEMSVMMNDNIFNDYWPPSKAAAEFISVYYELKEMSLFAKNTN